MNFHDFELLLTDDQRIRASSPTRGEQQETFRLDLDEIELALQLINYRKINQKLLKELGTRLYQALFPPGIHAFLQASFADAQAEDASLRLRLLIEPTRLSALPWEFLYEADTNVFLCTSRQYALSRYIAGPFGRRELQPTQLPLKVLTVISSPHDLDPLNAELEANILEESLARHLDAKRVEVDVIDNPSMRNINHLLEEKPIHVLHFIGHAVFKNEIGQIALLDEQQNAKLVDDETFSNLFLGYAHMRLVVLNACQGAKMSSQQTFAGMAPLLVQRGIPAVVAMQYPILDSSARIFADEFYWSLSQHGRIDQAIQVARHAISLNTKLDVVDFATPVLFMRSKKGNLLPTNQVPNGDENVSGGK